MKQLFFISMILLAASITNAQTSAETNVKKDIKTLKKEERKDRITLHKLEAGDVSYRAKANFAVDFNGATGVSWKRDMYYDVASFKFDSKDTKAYYDVEGNLVGSVNPASFSDLQPSAQKDIKKHFKDYTVQKVIFYNDNEDNDTDMILYDNQFNDADNYFAELTNGAREIVLQITLSGEVIFFKKVS